MADGINMKEVAKKGTIPGGLDISKMDETNSFDSIDGMTTVGDTPVVIAPPSNKPKNPNREVESQMMTSLMNTPTPTSTGNNNPPPPKTNTPPPVPKASAIGLDDDALDSSMDNMQMPSQINTGVEIHTEYQGFLVDGNFSEYQVNMVNELLKDVPEDEQEAIARPIFSSFEIQLRNMIQHGIDPDKAGDIALNNIRNQLTEENTKYKEEHKNSNVAEIIIDKSKASVDDLALTEEEHEKLEKVKRLRLILVEDTELKNITIERPSEEHKADYLRYIEGSLSKYQVPLVMLGDFVTFKGAQIIQLVSAINYEDITIDEQINQKATLIYDKLQSGSILHKYDERGRNTMTYNQFCNIFPYQDLDIAMYGILCASSMEETSTSLTCESCQHTWDHKYNIKSLLKMDHLSEDYKTRTGDIISNKSNDIMLNKLYNERKKARRYKSPFTGNIYDVSYPTVARAVDILKRIDQKDAVMAYVSAICLYISRILVYNKDKDSYIPIEAEEVDLMIDTASNLTNEDMTMIANQIRSDLFYEARFALDAECPSCHRKAHIPLNVENLIFLKAQDSMAEIEQ